MPHAIPETNVNFSEIIFEPYADLTRIRFIVRSESERRSPEMTYNYVQPGIERRFESIMHGNREEFEVWFRSAPVQAETEAIVQDILNDRALPTYVTVRAESILHVGSDSEDDGPNSSLRSTGSTNASASGTSNGTS